MWELSNAITTRSDVFSVTRSASEIHVLTGAARRAKILFIYKALNFCVFENEQPPKQPPGQNYESHLSGGFCNLLISMVFMAPEVGLEPTTLRLTAECSAIELLRSVLGRERMTRCASIVITNADTRVKGGCRGGVSMCISSGRLATIDREERRYCRS
jgi:hypothetical protein